MDDGDIEIVSVDVVTTNEDNVNEDEVEFVESVSALESPGCRWSPKPTVVEPLAAEIGRPDVFYVASLSFELQHAYRIVQDLMSDSLKNVNWPFVYSLEMQVDNMDDYKEVVSNPIWIMKILEKFKSGEYTTITEVVSDLRLMLENCYRYHGPVHPFTKKGLLLEQVLRQKLALLPRDLRDKTRLDVTSSDLPEEDGVLRRRSHRAVLGYSSALLNRVRNEKAERNRQVRRQQIEERKAEREEKEKEIVDWEDCLLKEPLMTQMKAMWELPQIGHFMYLCQAVLHLPEVPQYELERILMMPRESTLLARIMTSLLSNRNQRAKLDRLPPMPYKVWHHRLCTRVHAWYKLLHAKDNNAEVVFYHIGIEPLFFKILGFSNPLAEKQIYELTFHQKVWLLKGLCDYILHNHKSVQDALNEQSVDELREFNLGTDAEGNSYLHFPQFCGQDLRIYRQAKWVPPKLPAFSLESHSKHKILDDIFGKVGKKQKISNGTNSSKKKQKRKRTKHSSGRMKKAHNDKDMNANCDGENNNNPQDGSSIEQDHIDEFEPNINKFELIVDSVESLRKLKDKIECKLPLPRKTRNKAFSLQQKNESEIQLLEALKNLIVELEPWEVKLQQATKRMRQTLKKEWEEFKLHGTLRHETFEDVWKSDSENEAEEAPQITSLESGKTSDFEATFSSDYEPEEDVRRSKRRSVVKRRLLMRRSAQHSSIKQLKRDDEEEEEDEVVEYTDYSSRGRLRKIRMVFPKTEVVAKGLTSSETNDVIQNSLKQNGSVVNQSSAWETMQQILIPSKQAKVPSSPKQAVMRSMLVPNKKPVMTPKLARNVRVATGETAVSQKRTVKLMPAILINSKIGQIKSGDKLQTTLSPSSDVCGLSSNSGLQATDLVNTFARNIPLKLKIATTRANGQAVILPSLTRAQLGSKPANASSKVIVASGTFANLTASQTTNSVNVRLHSGMQSSSSNKDSFFRAIKRDSSNQPAVLQKATLIPAVDKEGNIMYFKLVRPTATEVPSGKNTCSKSASIQLSNDNVGSSVLTGVHESCVAASSLSTDVPSSNPNAPDSLPYGSETITLRHEMMAQDVTSASVAVAHEEMSPTSTALVNSVNYVNPLVQTTIHGTNAINIEQIGHDAQVSLAQPASQYSNPVAVSVASILSIPNVLPSVKIVKEARPANIMYQVKTVPSMSSAQHLVHSTSQSSQGLVHSASLAQFLTPTSLGNQMALVQVHQPHTVSSFTTHQEVVGNLQLNANVFTHPCQQPSVTWSSTSGNLISHDCITSQQLEDSAFSSLSEASAAASSTTHVVLQTAIPQNPAKIMLPEIVSMPCMRNVQQLPEPQLTELQGTTCISSPISHIAETPVKQVVAILKSASVPSSSCVPNTGTLMQCRSATVNSLKSLQRESIASSVVSTNVGNCVEIVTSSNPLDSSPSGFANAAITHIPVAQLSNNEIAQNSDSSAPTIVIQQAVRPVDRVVSINTSPKQQVSFTNSSTSANQTRLVLIQNSATNSQVLGVMLPNGQVIALNSVALNQNGSQTAVPASQGVFLADGSCRQTMPAVVLANHVVVSENSVTSNGML